MDRSFWRGRRVLVTGHTGFKGAWLLLWLQGLGARTTAFALPPEYADGAYTRLAPWTNVDEHEADLRDKDAVTRVVAAADPEVVVHLGAQALVRRSYEDPVGTWASNVLGTAHLLESVAAAPSVRAVVVVTSDKVYRNDGGGHAFKEDAPLGQADPYSSSKAAVELLIDSWRRSFPGTGGLLATARAGNVIGGGDRAVDRLVPDALRALAAGDVLRLRFPAAVRPWQHVLEPLHGYLLLAEALATGQAPPSAVNFGPGPESCQSVASVVETLHRLAGGGTWEELAGERREATLLRLDSGLAHASLGWRPRLDLETALAWTVEWHEAELQGGSLRELARDQVARYETLLDDGMN